MMNEVENQLCSDLLPIYKLELSLGNVIERVESPAGTKCPYAVVFKKRLNHKKIKELLTLPNSVFKWDNKDHHYELESGYGCEKTKHGIAGPL